MAGGGGDGSVPSSPSNYYETLGVEIGASQAEISKAYKKKALRCHPDRQPDDRKDAAMAEFKRLAEAYEALKDENSRARYDSHLASRQNRAPPSNASSGGSVPSSPLRGRRPGRPRVPSDPSPQPCSQPQRPPPHRTTSGSVPNNDGGPASQHRQQDQGFSYFSHARGPGGARTAGNSPGTTRPSSPHRRHRSLSNPPRPRAQTQPATTPPLPNTFHQSANGGRYPFRNAPNGFNGGGGGGQSNRSSTVPGFFGDGPGHHQHGDFRFFNGQSSNANSNDGGRFFRDSGGQNFGHVNVNHLRTDGAPPRSSQRPFPRSSSGGGGPDSRRAMARLDAALKERDEATSVAEARKRAVGQVEQELERLQKLRREARVVSEVAARKLEELTAAVDAARKEYEAARSREKAMMGGN